MKIIIESLEELERFRSGDNLPFVTNLCVAELNLTYFPEWICELPYLKVLNMSNNQIADMPRSFSKLGKSLNELYLNSNIVKKMPPSLGEFTNLSVLNLNDNDLQFLPDEIGNCTSLLNVYLNNNKNLKSLPDTFSFLNKLQALEASKCQLSSLPNDMKLPILQSLKLANNNISTLPPCIPSMVNLFELSLIGNPIPDSEKAVIKAALKYIPHIYL